MQASYAMRCVSVTYRVDKQHALHDVPEAGAGGIRQGVVHSLHYCLEEAALVLCLEGQLPLYSRQDSSMSADLEDGGVLSLVGDLPIISHLPSVPCFGVLPLRCKDT